MMIESLVIAIRRSLTGFGTTAIASVRRSWPHWDRGCFGLVSA
jgi:hypothetical protein